MIGGKILKQFSDIPWYPKISFHPNSRNSSRNDSFVIRLVVSARHNFHFRLVETSADSPPIPRQPLPHSISAYFRVTFLLHNSVSTHCKKDAHAYLRCVYDYVYTSTVLLSNFIYDSPLKGKVTEGETGEKIRGRD